MKARLVFNLLISFCREEMKKKDKPFSLINVGAFQPSPSKDKYSFSDLHIKPSNIFEFQTLYFVDFGVLASTQQTVVLKYSFIFEAESVCTVL
jgi:hypothetical protein